MNCLGRLYNSGGKYTFMIIWLAISALLFAETFYKYQTATEFYYTHQMLGITLCLSRGAAAALNLNCAAVVLPMCHTLGHKVRYLIRKYIPLRLSSWDGRSFHIFMAYVIVSFTGVHVSCHVINSYKFYNNYSHNIRDVNPFEREGMTPFCIITKTLSGVTGLMLMSIIVTLLVTTLGPIRRRFFNVFWYSHRIYPLFYILLALHGVNGPIRRQLNPAQHVPGCSVNITTNNSSIDSIPCAEPVFDHVGTETYIWLSFPLVIYFLDVLCRLVRRAEMVEVTSAVTIAVDILELKIRTRRTVQPGQVVLLNCGSISTLEWHPFSVVECPNATNNWNLTVWVKLCGDWTRDLEKVLCGQETTGKDVENNQHKSLSHVRMEGPYSGRLEAAHQYNVVVCVGGGIGVTPMLSHLQYLVQHRDSSKTKTKKMYFIFVTREATQLYACANHIKDLVEEIHRSNRDMLDVRFFYTGTVTAIKMDVFLLNKVHFGRPDLKGMFEQIHRQHKRQTVGVFCCGPDPLCCSVKKLCLQETTVFTKFPFHKEHF